MLIKMEDDKLTSYRKAGEIARTVRDCSRPMVTPGVKILDLAEKIESMIKKEGGELAFPTNICINDVTAHYTPKYNDETVLGEKDVVSVDLGVHINGFIADTAYTVDLSGEYSTLLEANEKALENAISLIKKGVSVSAVGEIVQSTLNKAGFKPVENLTGHEVQQYNLHAGFSVPNIKVPFDWPLEEDMVLAIEPFATNGCGRVVESKQAEIFSLITPKPTRLREARILLTEIAGRRELPFAQRWYCQKINPLKLNLALKELVLREAIKAYPTLHEKERGIVSQFEHTVVVTSDGCELLT